LKAGFNLIQINPGDKWITAFQMGYVYDTYQVILSELGKMSAIFQHIRDEMM
jgi:hypothetical protein